MEKEKIISLVNESQIPEEIKKKILETAKDLDRKELIERVKDILNQEGEKLIDEVAGGTIKEAADEFSSKMDVLLGEVDKLDSDISKETSESDLSDVKNKLGID